MRIRFTTRDLLWLMALIAVAFYWGLGELRHQYLARQNAVYQQQLEELRSRLMTNVQRQAQLEAIVERSAVVAPPEELPSK